MLAMDSAMLQDEMVDLATAHRHLQVLQPQNQSLKTFNCLLQKEHFALRQKYEQLLGEQYPSLRLITIDQPPSCVVSFSMT